MVKTGNAVAMTNSLHCQRQISRGLFEALIRLLFASQSI